MWRSGRAAWLWSLPVSPAPNCERACGPEHGLRGPRVQALRLTLTGLATAWAGPTAAPTATVLMTSAATMATRVRVNCDCDDISNLPFSGPLHIVVRASADT